MSAPPRYGAAGWEQWPELPLHSMQFARALAVAQQGAATISECFLAASRMEPADPLSWHREWSVLARANRARADAALSRGHTATALANLPDDIEAAAATLGATPWRVVRRVTLPLATPGLIACACLSFLLSFDETVISLFIAGPRASTLPVEMVRYVEGRTDPLIAALSVVLIVATLAVVLVVERLVGVARAVGK